MKHLFDSLRSTPLIYSTLFFICGLGLARYFGPTSVSANLLFGTTSLLLSCFFIFFIARKQHLVLLCLLPVVLLFGWYHGQNHLRLPPDSNHIYYKVGSKQEAVLVGTIMEMVSYDGQLSKTVLDLESIRFEEDAVHQAAIGEISLALKGPWPETCLPGDKIMVRGSIKRPRSVLTPGAFSFETYLAKKGVYATAFIRNPVLIHKLTPAHGLWFSPRLYAEQIRTKIGKYLDTSLTPQDAALYRAIMLGDKSSIEDHTIEVFKKCGTMHILAISGLHMSVVGGMLYFLFHWLLTRSQTIILHTPVRKLALVLTIPLIMGYGLLTGCNTPVIRAMIMSIFFIFAIYAGRLQNSFSILSCAAFLILLIEPLQLFTISFLLSFTAVIAILSIAPVLKLFVNSASKSNKKPHTSVFIAKLNTWFIVGLGVSLTATFATMPLTLLSFHQVSTIGPLANLIFEPLICLWALPLGLLSIPIQFFSTQLGDMILAAGTTGLHLALQAGSLASMVPGSDFRLPSPFPLTIIIYYSGLIMLLFCWNYNIRFLYGGAAVLALSIIHYLEPRFSNDYAQDKKDLEINIIDVGQGSANLVEFPSGYKLLIDGGSSSFQAGLVGENVIAPFLWQKGITRIDGVLITHPDADHYNGIPFIISHFSPETVWVRDRMGHDAQYQNLIELAEQTGAKVLVPEDGMILVGTAEDYATSIAGHGNETGKLIDHKNNSLVTKICAGTACILFPGDIEAPFEQELIMNHEDLVSEVLLAPHHGSATSSSEEFMAKVDPQIMIVSAGQSGTGVFPSNDLIKKCSQKQILLYNTANEGTIALRFKDKTIQLSGHRHQQGNPLLSLEEFQLLEKETCRP